ncbi:MAG: TIGR03016 family PEP-CTERM system-associated outer membrane protein [Thermodesulfobacteriota bacterium]
MVILPGKAHGVFKKSFFISIQDDYNDNIFLTPDNEEEDFVIRQNLGFSLSNRMPRYDLSLNYGFEAKLYSKFTDANNEKHTVSARSHSEIIKNVIYFDVEDTFTRIPSDIRRPALAEEVDVNLTDVNSFKFSSYVKSDIGPRMKLKAGYTYLRTDYNGSAASDTNYNIVFEKLERRFSPKSTASVDYEFKQKLTDGLTDEFLLHKVSLSSSYKMSTAMTLNAAAGNAWFDFETMDNTSNLFWNVDIKSSFSESDGITIHYGRNFNDSPEKGAYTSDVASLSVYYGNRLKVNGKLVIRTDDYFEIDREDRINRAEMGLSWQATSQFNLSVNGYTTGEDFSSPSENISSWGAELKGSYEFHRLATFEARYKHSDRDSDVGSSFVNNIYTLMLRADI